MKLLVLDGNSIFNRAFYGIKLLTTKKGFYTNAIYGFITMLNKLQEEAKPDAVAIAFDMKAPTFRHKKYAEYKANRKGMPDELFMQFPVLKNLLVYLGYKLVEKEGYEADDIIGTFAKKCSETDNECIIATGDRDSLQLVSPKVSVRMAATKFGRPEVTLYDEEKIYETYGVKPTQLIDIKAIQGDTSDNIPGVPGIGQKGALELIQKFKNLDYIYENLDTLDIKPGMRKKLIEGKESAYLSRELGTIFTDVPIDLTFSHYVKGDIDVEKTVELMSDLEMFSLMKKMGIQSKTGDFSQNENKGLEREIVLCKDSKKLKDILNKFGEANFDFNVEDGDITAIAFCVNEKIYILKQENINYEFFKFIFENKKIKKRTNNVKNLFLVLDKMGIELNEVDFDVQLAAYILNPNAKGYNLEGLANEYKISVKIKAEENNRVQLTSSEKEIIIDENASIAESAAVIAELVNVLVQKINENGQKNLFEKIEIPLAIVLAKMENRGFFVCKEGLKEYGNKLEAELKEIERKIFEYIGAQININSPKQLGTVLFEEMGLPKGKKTKTGYSTSAEVLESIKYVHPVIELILQYRALSKLKSTYCDGMLKVIGADGRIHSNFNQTETRTGRISSTEPNLQNIPVRTSIGREFRRFFCAKEGFVLVDADYSQVELRILAHISKDENMINAFKNNLDIHTETAAQVFKMPPNMVTPIMRSRAKAVNFGIVYGIGAFSLAKDLGVTTKEASAYIKSYFDTYSGVAAYMEDVIKSAKEKGYAETIFGRRRYLPELSSSNHNLRAFGERVARNMPIQGSAADIIKIAMINVEKRLKDEGLEARLILQVHDELIIEAPEAEADRVSKLLCDEMQNAAKISVPLTVTTNVGKTWYDTKD